MQDSYASGHSLHVRVTQTLQLNNNKLEFVIQIAYKGSANFLLFKRFFIALRKEMIIDETI